MLIPERQEALMRRAMQLAAESANEGNLPFAAILVDRQGTIVLESVNTVNTTHNAAAHAEINLLYKAGEELKTNDLSGYCLVSNAASCPMCATALIKAKITEFYYGAPNEGKMIPSISMNEVMAKVPFPVETYGNILGDECAAQIKELAKR